MFSYAQLDKVADSINQVLAIVTLLIPWIAPAGRRCGPIQFLAGACMGVVLGYRFQYCRCAAR